MGKSVCNAVGTELITNHTMLCRDLSSCMESISTSMADSPYEEQYSDVRTDSFGILSRHLNSISVSFPRNHPTQISDSDSCDNFDSAGTDTFQFMNSGVFEGVYLNTEIDKQGDMCLLSVHAVGRSPRSNTVKLAVGSLDDDAEQDSFHVDGHSIEMERISVNSHSIEKESINDNDYAIERGSINVNGYSTENGSINLNDYSIEKGSINFNGYSIEKESISVNGYPIEKAHTDRVVYPVFARIKEHDLGFPSLSNQYNPTSSLTVGDKGAEICHNENMSNEVTLPLSVQVFQTETVAGTTQTFLVNDLDINFGRNNSGNNSLCLKTKKVVPGNSSENITLGIEEGIATKGKTHETHFASAEASEVNFVESELTSDKFATSTCNSEPSRRSLRVRTVHQVSSLLTSPMFSGNKDATDYENGIRSTGDVKIKMPKILNHKAVVKDYTCKVKLYSCKMCNVICKAKADLKQHKQIHIVSRLMTCTLCGFVCKRKTEMRKHKETHGTESLYTCEDCGYSSNRLKYLKKHMHTHSMELLLSCHLCDFKPTHRKVLEKHLREHPNLKMYPREEYGESFSEKSDFSHHMLKFTDSNVCPHALCGAAFEEGEQLKKHDSIIPPDFQKYQTATCSSLVTSLNLGNNVLQDIDSNGGDDTDSIQHTSTVNDTNNIRDLHIQDCNKNTSQENQLLSRTYKCIKMKRRSLQCTMCSYSCMSKNALSCHMVQHSDNKPCVCCGASFTRKDHLKVHKLTHESQRPYKCSHCGYQTHRRRGLTLHVVKHQSNKPVSSSLSVLKCKRKCDLRSQMKIKHGVDLHPEPSAEQPHTAPADIVLKCEMCDYTCDSHKRWKYHMTRHENKTPHCCPHCEYKCSSRSSLADHLLQHAGIKPCLCSECGIAFRNTSRLNRHKLVHLDVKPYGCNFCSFSSRSKYNLKQHTLRHTDQQKVRIRNRKSSKPKVNNFTAGENIQQGSSSSCGIEAVNPFVTAEVNHVTADVSHVTTGVCLPNVQPHRNDSYLAPDDRNVSEVIESFEESAVPQYVMRNQLDISDYYKERDKIIEQSSNTVFNTIYHSANLTINPYPVDRTSYSNVMTPAQTYSDLYPNLNLSFGNSPSIPCSANVNTGYTNPDFYYVDRNGDDYGFASPYFYNEGVFPGSVNTNMAFYVFQSGSNGCALTPAPCTSTNQNIICLNCPANEITTSVLPQQPELSCVTSSFPIIQNHGQYISEVVQNHRQYISEVVQNHSQYISEVVQNHGQYISEVVQNHSQYIPEVEESRVDNLSMSEDVSDDVPVIHSSEAFIHNSESVICSCEAVIHSSEAVIHSSEAPKPPEPRSQAKKTGATLTGSRIVKNSTDEHVKKTTHICSECGYICLTNTMLQRHKTTHVDFKPHKCDDCGKSFKRVDHMKAHKRSHAQSKPHSCGLCPYTCSRKYRLKLHEKTHRNEHPLSCSVCEASFDSEPELEEHKKLHSDGYIFACNKCDFKCKDKMELTSHRHDHKSFLCVICSYVCRSAREFNSHMKMHGKKDELVCSLCSYTCDSQKRLKYHLKRHENKTPYECPHCDYRCSSRSSLTDHLLQHEGLKPFLCSVCGMKFRNVSRLNRHKMTHTDLKPHICGYCLFSSRSKYNLEQHILRHFK